MAGDDATLVDLLDGLLDNGAVVSGDLLLSVAGIDLAWIGLQAVITSVENGVPDGSAIASAAPRLAEGAVMPTKALVAPAEGTVMPAEPRRAEVPAPAPTRPASPGTGPPPHVPANLATSPARDRQREHLGKGLERLVLTLVDTVRQLLERQAVSRMVAGSLSDEEVERLGSAMRQLSQRMVELKETFGLTDDDLRLDVGPVLELSG